MQTSNIINAFINFIKESQSRKPNIFKCIYQVKNIQFVTDGSLMLIKKDRDCEEDGEHAYSGISLYDPQVLTENKSDKKFSTLMRTGGSDQNYCFPASGRSVTLDVKYLLDIINHITQSKSETITITFSKDDFDHKKGKPYPVIFSSITNNDWAAILWPIEKASENQDTSEFIVDEIREYYEQQEKNKSL